MSLKVGIVGLPNVGKSTLFNSLLKKRVALSANYPFATIEPNIGVVAVPDERLQKLAELTAVEEKMIPEGLLDGSRIKSGMTEEAKKYFPPIIPAVVEFVDIAGLVKGASTGAGLGNQFLSHIREVDAIIHVLRDFEDANIVREGSTDPKSDQETIETELAFADLEVLEKLTDNIKKEAKSDTKLRNGEKMLQLLEEIKINLEQGKILGKYEIGDEYLKHWFGSLPLLTTKPVLYIYNVSENEFGQKYSDRDKSVQRNENEIVICAKIEEELVDLTEEERQEYLKELGIDEPGLERLIKKAYTLLGLISFLTAGKKEVRAWTVRKGAKAPQAAGVIHTDFEKKFIRAQVISCDELLVHGSWKEAREAGKVRTEGKDYEMKDGDVVEFLIGS